MAIITKTAGQTNLNPTSPTAANRTSDTDDLIIINTATALAATNTINGGDGTDEIRVGGNGAAGTFNLGANVTNIENVVIGSGNVPGLGNAVVTNANHNVNASLVASALNIVGNNGNNIINGGSGNDTINGGAGNDTLNGNAGADSIVGGLGNDIINGGAGTDTLQGGDGNDTFIVTKGADTTIFERIQGGDQLLNGADLIRFSSAAKTDILSLGNQVTGIESIALGATAASTNALSVNASLVGNALTITGNAGANNITATAYDDTITGGAGNDTIAAGGGNDIITGGAGRDSLVGGGGDDTYLYTSAAEFAAGESITDTDGFDVIRHTGTGTISLNNLVDGIEAVEIGTSISSTNAGGVNASAVENSLSIYGNNGANTLIGTAYGDYIIGAAGNDNISGNDGNDFIVGGAGADTIKGGDGNDFIVGESADSIDGGLDYDRLYVQANYTQANNARLTGVEEVGIYGAGNININLTGQTESFYIYGNSDNNSITGGSGNDVIYGGDGNDSLVGGAGNDVMYGGAEDGKIDGGIGVDTLVVGDSGYSFVAGSNASLVGIENVEIDYDLDYAFLDLSTQSEGFNILGGYGEDTIIGGAGADNIDAGYGYDTIAITSVASYAIGDTINGGYGYDTILVDVGAEDADATIQLANVTDIERVVITGDVNINVDASQVEVEESDRGYAPIWYGPPMSDFEIIGNNGDNYIVGTSSDDEITGYGGNDILDAGDGFDTANFRGRMSDYVITEMMAGDILLYQADIVPIGDDQRQHLELARDIAERFNSRFGEVFTVPDGFYPEVGARIMSLQDPAAKMGKTGSSEQGTVRMLDAPDVVMKKFKTAVTDSGREVRKAEDKPGISNLIDIMSVATGSTPEQIEAEYGDAGYGTFKVAVGEAVVALLEPIRERYLGLRSDEGELLRLLALGADKARAASAPTLERMYETMGFVRNSAA